MVVKFQFNFTNTSETKMKNEAHARIKINLA